MVDLWLCLDPLQVRLLHESNHSSEQLELRLPDRRERLVCACAQECERLQSEIRDHLPRVLFATLRTTRSP